jgi:hypothetical protein
MRNIPTWLEIAIREAEAEGVLSPMKQEPYKIKEGINSSSYQVKGMGGEYFFYEDIFELVEEDADYARSQLKKNPLLYVSEEDLNYYVKMKDQYKRKLVRNIAKEYLENEIYPLGEGEVYRIADLDPTHFDIEEAYAEILEAKKAEIERVLDKYPILYPMKELGMPLKRLLRVVDMNIEGLIELINSKRGREINDYLKKAIQRGEITYLPSDALVVYGNLHTRVDEYLKKKL